jgi:hypothetical protein
MRTRRIINIKRVITSIIRILMMPPMNQKTTTSKISITNMDQDASTIMDIIMSLMNTISMDLDAIIITIIIITPPIQV